MDIHDAYERLLTRQWGAIPLSAKTKENRAKLIPKLIQDKYTHQHLGVAQNLDRLLDALYLGVREQPEQPTSFDQNIRQLKTLCRSPLEHLDTHEMRAAILLIVVGNSQGAESCRDMIAKIKAEHKKDSMLSNQGTEMINEPGSLSRSSRSRSDRKWHSPSSSERHTSEEYKKVRDELRTLHGIIEGRYEQYLKKYSSAYWQDMRTILEAPIEQAIILAQEDRLPDSLMAFIRAQAQHGIVNASGHSEACEVLPPGPVRNKCERMALLFKQFMEEAEEEQLHNLAIQEEERKQKQNAEALMQTQHDLEKEREEAAKPRSGLSRWMPFAFRT